MNILERVTRFFNNLSLTNPKAWDPSLWHFASDDVSGENVNEYSALNYSAIWNAINLISGSIAAMPLHLMQRKDDKKRIVSERGLYRVMHDAWNPYVTAMAGRETLLSHALSWGNGYAEKVFNGLDEIVELWPITPNRVTPRMLDGELVYEIIVGTEKKVLPRRQILHIPGFGFDGIVGYNVIAMARRSIGLSMAMETFGATYFGNGTHPGVIISHPGKLSEQTAVNLRKSLTESYSGLGKAHRLMLLEDAMKIEKVGVDPEDSQFLESRQFQIPEIARWFNLPPHKLKDLTKSSFNNIESEQGSFYSDSLLPWLVRLEQNYNMQLLTKGDRLLYGGGSLYFKHNYEGILRTDTQKRGEFYSKMFGIGAMSINEIREKEDMDPIAGGDEHFVPLNMVPVSKIDQYIDLQIKQKEQPKTTPEKEDDDDPDVAKGGDNG